MSLADLPDLNPPNTAPASSVAFAPSSRTAAGSASNDEDASMEGLGRSMRQIERTVKSLKQRGDQYKQQLRVSLKQTSDLRLESAEGSRELRERVEMLEEKLRRSEAAKERANSRLGGYKGHLQEARGELKVAKNRIEYLEKLLAFEERSGFSTLYSELQLK